MMSRAIAYGIDFGTTNSLISVAHPDRVDLLHVGTAPTPATMPSLTYLHRDGHVASGEDAVAQYTRASTATHQCGSCDRTNFYRGSFVGDCRDARPGGGCFDARLLAEVKRFLSDPDLASTHSWGSDYSMPQIVGIVLRHLKRRADAAIGQDLTRAVVGHPVVYPGAEGARFAEMQATALDRMKHAAAIAGFHEIVLYQEPAAAILADGSPGTVMSVDFGGGTFDVAIIDKKGGHPRALALTGVAVGGEDFDEALFELLLHDELGLAALPSRVRTQVRRLSSLLPLLSRDGLRSDLREAARFDRRVKTLEAIVFGGHTLGLFQEIERVKLQLSEENRATFDFQRQGVDLFVEVTRKDFEEAIAPMLRKVEAQIEGALTRAGLEPTSIDAVVRTGGSSSLPAFIDILNSRFPKESIHQPDAFATIVTGLAEHARKTWT